MAFSFSDLGLGTLIAFVGGKEAVTLLRIKYGKSASNGNGYVNAATVKEIVRAERDASVAATKETIERVSQEQMRVLERIADSTDKIAGFAEWARGRWT